MMVDIQENLHIINELEWNYRWDWGPNKTDYSFVIKPDGVGLYYDFSYVQKGESIKARDVYKCYKR
jgi:hypothetical protein